MQNISHAVMSQRYEPNDSADDFPTPPWATRALMKHVIKNPYTFRLICLEPACGRGYMSRTLSAYFGQVKSYDKFCYGNENVRDFLTYPYAPNSYSWVITNPPFKKAYEFIDRALPIAKNGVAILARTVFLEGAKRYEKLFKDNPPTYFAQFVERVPMVKGRLDKTASTATSYAWFVWLKRDTHDGTKVIWIPPCRKDLEKPEDYY